MYGYVQNIARTSKAIKILYQEMMYKINFMSRVQQHFYHIHSLLVFINSQSPPPPPLPPTHT